MENSAAEERQFLKIFAAVLAALVLFTLFCVVLARTLAPGYSDSDPLQLTARQERIAPVGSVNTSEDQIETQAVATADTASAGPQSAEDIITTSCAACHQTGVADAPKLDDAAAWETRRELGVDALLASVINGKGAMPPRAGTTLSDDELKAAVELMAGFSSGESADAAGSDSSGATAVTAVATAATAAVTDAAETATETVKEVASSAVEGAKAAVEEAKETVAEAADKVEEATSAVAGAVAGAVASAGGAAELDPAVKSIADTLCAGCHIAGVANAPKLGDKEAWAARAEKGMDGMTQVVVTGLNAMPPRGGSTLTDEQISAAIEYMMAQ